MPRRAPLAALLIVASWTAPANSLGISPADRVRLDHGEVVLVDRLPQGGRGGPGEGGTAMALVHASPDAVWRVLTDYPRHRGLYPHVVSAEVLESGAVRAVVRYVVGVGPFSFGFHVENRPAPTRRRLDWRLDHARPNELFRDSWGYWEIEPYGPDVVLTYAMAARTVLPAFLTRGSEKDGLVATLKAVRDRAEQRPPGPGTD